MSPLSVCQDGWGVCLEYWTGLLVQKKQQSRGEIAGSSG